MPAVGRAARVDAQIFSVLSIPDQSRRLGHPQTERLDDSQNACEAGALVLRGFVALDLLRLQGEAVGQAFLRHSRRDSVADQGLRQVLYGFEDEFLALSDVQVLVGADLLLQFLQLALSGGALRLP